MNKIWSGKCLPQIYAEFDRTQLTRMGQIFADLIEENLEWDVSPADDADGADLHEVSVG